MSDRSSVAELASLPPVNDRANVQRDEGPLTRRHASAASPISQHAAPAAPTASALTTNAIQMFADAMGAGSEVVPVQLDGDGRGLASHDVHRAAAHGLSGSGGALPHRDAIQQSFGRHDISAVQAHIGDKAAEGSAAMGARAYASGAQVAFASSPDLHLAAHEAAHVVQQRGGVQLSGGVGASGDGYERHADAVADRVARGESAEALLDQHAPSHGGGGGTVQQAVQRQDHRPAAHTSAGRTGNTAAAMAQPTHAQAAGHASPATAHDGAHGHTGPAHPTHAAGTPALERQLVLHNGLANEGIQGAAMRANQLAAEVRHSLTAIIASAQHSFAEISRWRRSIDAHALAEIDTDTTSGGLGIGRTVAVTALGMVPWANPMVGTVIGAIDAAISVAQGIADLDGMSQAQAMVDASASASGLAGSSESTVLRTILVSSHSAVAQFYANLGRLREATSSDTGTAGAMLAADTRRQRASMHAPSRDFQGTPEVGSVHAVEATGLHALDQQARAATLLTQLDRAAEVMRRAPALVDTAGRQALTNAQVQFAGGAHASHVAITGRLVLSSSGITLTINNIGSSERQTPLAATLADLAAMGITCELALEITHPELVPHILAEPSISDVGVAERAPSQSLLTATISRSGPLAWHGVAIEMLGQAALTRRGAPVAREAAEPAAVAGQRLLLQLEQLLHSRSLSQLRDAAL